MTRLVDAVDRARIEEYVLTLDTIGPRPVSDDDATRATVDFIANYLRRFGYEVHEEEFEVDLPGKVLARARPIDSPDAEPIELEVAPDLVSAGREAMRATSALLATEGWKVEGYVIGGERQALAVPNLIAFRKGSREPLRVVELSAHYDTVPGCPGASDNSSGVAALLEVARVIAQAPTNRSVRFCFFGAEEIGLRGSRAHVERLSDDPSETVEALINLDSVGFAAHEPGSQAAPPETPWFLSPPDIADFVAVLGDRPTGWLGNAFEAAIDTYTPDLPYYSLNRLGSRLRNGGRSDHAVYWEANLPAILITDTGNFRNAAYHTAGDTPDTLDFAFVEAVTRATTATLLHLAELEDPGL